MMSVPFPDVLAFDAPRRVLYVAAESGPLTAFSETDTGLELLAQQDVGPNAHSLAVDPESGHAYIPIANLGGQPVTLAKWDALAFNWRPPARVRPPGAAFVATNPRTPSPTPMLAV